MPSKSLDVFSNRYEGLDASTNPFVAKLRDRESNGLPICVGKDLEGRQGRWRELGERRSESPPASPKSRLFLEIGCHKGQTLTHFAELYQQDVFVGLDITYKRVVLTAQRAVDAGLTNVQTALANAKALSKLFAPGELTGVMIFFPDPWPKARQQKNRLIQPEFCQQLLEVLEPESGFVWLKTDHEEYYGEAVSALNASGLLPDQSVPLSSNGLPSDSIDQPIFSSFERRFGEQGLPTYSGVWRAP